MQNDADEDPGPYERVGDGSKLTVVVPAPVGEEVASSSRTIVAKEWQSDLCDCFVKDLAICGNAFFAAPCVFGQNLRDRDHAKSCISAPCVFCTCFPCVFGTIERGHTREKYQIPGSTLEDFCLHTFCCWCSLAQERREMMMREPEVMYNRHRHRLNLPRNQWHFQPCEAHDDCWAACWPCFGGRYPFSVAANVADRKHEGIEGALLPLSVVALLTYVPILLARYVFEYTTYCPVLGAIYGASERYLTRKRYGINGSTCKDYTFHCLCPCCAVQQEQLEIWFREQGPGVVLKAPPSISMM